MSVHRFEPRLPAIPLHTYPARCPRCGQLLAWDRRYREAWCVSRWCREWGQRHRMPPKDEPPRAAR